MSSITQLPDSATAHIPFAIRDPNRIPRERYYDRAFHDLEKEKLWLRTWQMACRLEEIPQANDFVEYEIGDESILVVRQRDGAARAFFNACRHRGTQLAKGAGRFGGGNIICPFHGWRWKTDGSSSMVYGEHGFTPECLHADEIKLKECKAEIWGGCVWINPDPKAGPLREALEPVASKFDAVGVGDMRVLWWKEIVLNCNWKVAQEAFMEGFHVMQTHPQLTMGTGPTYEPNFISYQNYPGGHSSLNGGDDVLPQFPDVDVAIGINRVLFEGMGDCLVLPQDMQVLEGVKAKIKPGDDVRQAIGQAFRQFYKDAGIPMIAGIEEQPWWWATNTFLFPNYFILTQYGNAISYRSRPYNDDPEWCRFEIWSLTTPPASAPPPTKRVTLDGRFDKDDASAWGRIPIQDYANIERQQRGMHSSSFESQRLSKWERNISHMHRELDHRLARP